MRRSVRNGLAIAGMAGGILFLGDAVAGASTDATATGDIASTTAGPRLATAVPDVIATHTGARSATASPIAR